MRKCLVCEKGNLKEADDIISEIEGHTFVSKGLRCTYCKDEFLGEKETQKMINAARKLGIWGPPLKLRRRLSRSARTTVLRIPSDVEKDFKLKGTEEVLISKAGKRRMLVEVL